MEYLGLFLFLLLLNVIGYVWLHKKLIIAYTYYREGKNLAEIVYIDLKGKQVTVNCFIQNGYLNTLQSLTVQPLYFYRRGTQHIINNHQVLSLKVFKPTLWNVLTKS